MDRPGWQSVRNALVGGAVLAMAVGRGAIWTSARGFQARPSAMAVVVLGCLVASAVAHQRVVALRILERMPPPG